MAERTWIHAFTDGRDVSPHAAADDLATLPPDRIATVVGRYYAMDRDKRWDRTDRALDAMVGGIGAMAEDPVAAVRASYERGVTDEFVEPVVLRDRPRLDPAKDAVIVFNFRPDRVRQLTQRLLEANADVVTMTRYSDDFDCPVAFGEQTVPDTLAETLSDAGLRQLHAAETEKYAHVTYFFNGGVEEPCGGEDANPRAVAPGRRELRPEAGDVRPGGGRTRSSTRSAEGYGFCVVNFANPDMVGHTGVIPAVVSAVETADACLGHVVEATHRAGGVCLVTADHGNAEKLLEDDGVSPHTAHTTNPVPLVAHRGRRGASRRRRAVRSRADGPGAPRPRAARRDDRHEPRRPGRSLTRHRVVNCCVKRRERTVCSPRIGPDAA